MIVANIGAPAPRFGGRARVGAARPLTLGPGRGTWGAIMPGSPAAPTSTVRDHVALRRDPARYGLALRAGADGAPWDEVWMEGVALERIASEVGTPTYVYGAGAIRARFRALRAALDERPVHLCYAVKANDCHAVLRVLAELGAGADIVSGGELARALAAGIPAARVVFSGVGKRDDEIDRALAAGVGTINAESPEELAQISARARRAGTVARVALRINPDVSPKTHPYLATGLREAKFGMPMVEGFEAAVRAAADPNLTLVGLACHIGSQIVEADPFLQSLQHLRDMMARLAAHGVRLTQLDLGGGMAIPYAGDDPELDVAAWGRALARATADLDVTLVLEPGRYLVGNAGVLLTRVIGRKRNGPRRFVVVDAAMNDLVRPALYQAYHAVVPVELPRAPETEVVDVVGPVCETGDFLALQREQVVARAGDVLAVLSAGAYGASMASTYNSRPLPAEVLVDGDSFAVVRPRQTLDELLARDVVPGR